MGREIERILHERGHEAALVIDTENAAELDAEHLRGIDVALEFTTPATAYRNIRRAGPTACPNCRRCAANGAGRCSTPRTTASESISCSASTAASRR